MLTGKLSAQTILTFKDTSLNVNFRIVDSQTQEPVGLAHIINLTRNTGVISDLLGYLNLPVGFGDSIIITAIGYNSKEILSWGQFKSDTMFYSISLAPKVYEIKEVKISRFSTYEKFLREFANLKLPKNKEEEQLIRLQGYFMRIVRGMDLQNLPGVTSGASFGRDWYARQNEKLAELLDKEIERKKIDQKYNPGLIQKLTGLKGDELYEFMGQIGVESDFILKSSDYEIREKILKEFENFKRKKEVKNENKK
jgi:hypothetical protein